ncbi:M56 family metallopeptidase [Mucilaginibacter sp. CAU 1740]|uniref:M56 family metallopeptidase n=1 Tax=Mucilaginibacter sp. CAU 1740 TaxID=3140365 RepID=UPI00325BA6C2
MITTLLKFVACSGILLLVYHLMLKSKAIYRFNRFFLLASVVFALLVPFVTVKVHQNVVEVVAPVKEQVVVISEAVEQTISTPDVKVETPVNYGYAITLGVYCLVTGMLLFRFAKNIYHISQTAKRNVNIKYKQGYIVLIKQQLTPHTFFNRIFLNEEDYYHDKITDQVFQHELAHARQWHSADVVFIELVQVFCWFSPFVPFYKKAIQLNHEFLADEAVLQGDADVTSYQYQLLNSAGSLSGLSVASQFNYSLTKKRLIMMTRKTSTLSAVLSKAAIFTVMAAAFIVFCNAVDVSLPKQVADLKKALTNVVQDTTRQDTFPKVIATKYPEYPYSKEGVSEQLLNEYHTMVDKQIVWYNAHKFGPVLGADTARLRTIYSHMSKEQQKEQRLVFQYVGMPLAPSRPTAALFQSFKNERQYGVWLNDKHINNSELDKYKASDIGQYFISRLAKTAINYNKYKYQVNLATVDYYKEYCKKAIAGRYNSIMITRSRP